MSFAILPVVKSLWLCDDVLPDLVSGKIHLLGCFNAVRATAYPHRLGQICVVAQLAGGVGDITMRVEITKADGITTVYSSPEYPLHFQSRHSIVRPCIRIRECLFPTSGEYTVVLYCNGTFLDDRTLYLLDAEAIGQ